MSTQERKLIQRQRQLPGLQPEQTIRSMETVPAPGTGTLASPGTLISSFCILFAFSLPGLLTLSASLRRPDFSGAVTPSGWQG